MKKILSRILCVAICCTVLCACGDNKDKDTNETSSVEITTEKTITEKTDDTTIESSNETDITETTTESVTEKETTQVITQTIGSSEEIVSTGTTIDETSEKTKTTTIETTDTEITTQVGTSAPLENNAKEDYRVAFNGERILKQGADITGYKVLKSNEKYWGCKIDDCYTTVSGTYVISGKYAIKFFESNGSGCFGGQTTFRSLGLYNKVNEEKSTKDVDYWTVK